MAEFILSDIEVDIAGKSNPASIKREIYYALISDIVTIPPLDGDKNQISVVLGMRPGVTANPTATPPVLGVPGGRFAKITASEADIDFKCDKIGEGDNHAGFKVTVNAFLNGKTARASHLLAQLRHRRLALIVTEKDGQRYLIYDIILHYESQVNPKRGYHLKGETILSDEPPVYTAGIPVA
jgi:hypothetical protein